MKKQTGTYRLSLSTGPSRRRLTALMLILAGVFAVVGATPADSTDPKVTASFAGNPSVAPDEHIRLDFTRPVNTPEETVSIICGNTDITRLFEATDTQYAYTGALPLPPGDQMLVVYLVSNGRWREIGRFKLVVSEPAPAAGPTRNDPGKLSFTPSITLGLKSQPAGNYVPASNPLDRERYTDVTMQGSFRIEMPGTSVGSQMQFDIAGSTYRREALRFAQEGDSAPGIDLASYLMQFQLGKARLQVGHLAVGSNRHLINGFASRGLSLTLPVNRRADVSLAAINGANIVGWTNFFGLSQRKHQIASGTVGFEFAPETPGRVRVEAGLLHGSLLPITNFNQGNITDAEQSRGASFRLIANAPGDLFRIDAGVARSRFTNPSDPALNQSFNVVAVREATRGAHYFDATMNVLRNASIGDTRKANLAISYRHEMIEPLFKSVAAFNQADRFQNQFEAVAAIADVTATVSHLRYNDNLDDIPSILKTLTRRTSVLVGTPLVSLFGGASKAHTWWPRVSFGYERTHQFGAALPLDSGFSPSHVPDQVSDLQTVLADWQLQRFRWGYRFNRSFQDNRQPGRESADLNNVINAFTFGMTPHPSFDLNLETSLERARNFETSRIDHTSRVGVSGNWRMTGNSIVAATVSTLLAGDNFDAGRNRSAEFDLQWSYRFALQRGKYRKAAGQFFIRYADRYTYSFDRIFGFNDRTKVRTLNLGLSFTFF